MNNSNAFKDLDRYADESLLQELELSNGNINNLDNFDNIDNYDETYSCSLRFGIPLIYNKSHIDLKNGNNTRFPQDKEIRSLITRHAQNYQELILEIVERIFYDYNCKDSMIRTINAKIPEGIVNCPYYNYLAEDEVYKFSIYHNLKFKDKTGRFRFFQIEAAIGIALTFLTFDNIPLAFLKYENWDSKIGIKHEPTIKALRSAIKQNTKDRLYINRDPLIELIEQEVFKRNVVRYTLDNEITETNIVLIPHPKIVLSPIFYIMGYSTWVKEVDKYFNYIPNNGLNHPDKGDLYTNPKKFGKLDDNHIFKSSFNYEPKSADEIFKPFLRKLIDYELNRNK